MDLYFYGGFIWFYMDFLFLNGGFFSPQTMVVWYGFRPPRSGWSGYLKRVVSFEQGMHQQPGRPVWSFYGVVSNRWNNIFELSTIFGMMIPWMTHILGWVETTNHISIPWWFAQNQELFGPSTSAPSRAKGWSHGLAASCNRNNMYDIYIYMIYIYIIYI